MAQKRSAFVSAFIFSLGLMAAVAPSFGQTGPVLTASDGTNTITVTSSGAVCTAGSCSTTHFALITAGEITWSGTLGTFAVHGLTGQSKPEVAAPNMDVGISSIQTGSAGGTLTITWSDNGFYESGGTTGMYTPATITGTGSITFNSYIDNTNNLYGQPGASPVLLGTVTVSAPGGSPYTPGPAPTVSPYSLTQMEIISVGAATSVTFDDQLSGVPGQLTLNCGGGAVLDLSGSTLTLYGAVTGLSGISSGCFTLATLNTTTNFTGLDLSSTTAAFQFAGLSSMTDSSVLLGDLGLTGDTPTSLGTSPSIGGINGTGTTTKTFQADSNMFTQNLSSPTPEPVSLVLAASGLGIVLMLSRRRKSNDVSPMAQSNQ